MPNPDGSISFEEATSGQPAQPSSDGPISYEELTSQRAPDPVKEATSASAAAVADNSWFSPEFRSGELFKEVVAPVAAAARATAQAAGRVLGPLMPSEAERKQIYDYATANQMTPEETTDALKKWDLPPVYKKALDQTLESGIIPKETMPMYWAGKEAQWAARIFNPQGPAGARYLRTGLEAAGGFETKGAEAVSGMTTPFNALLAVAPEALPVRLASLANKGLALYFLQQALRATPNQLARFNAATTTGEKAGIVAETLVSYAPAAAFHGMGREARVAAGRRGEEPTSEPVGTTEMPPTAPEITAADFRSSAEAHLNDLVQRQSELTPEEHAEAKDFQDGLAEGGDLNALAKKYGVELSDVTPPEEPTAQEGEAPAAAPEETPAAPVEQAPVDAGTSRFRGVMSERMSRAAFIRGIRSMRDELIAKSPISDSELDDLHNIDSTLRAAEAGQVSRIDKLAKDHFGIELTEGGEADAQQPGNAQVETTPAPLGQQEGTPGAEPPAGSGDNVVGETPGEEAGGPVPQETPVVTPAPEQAAPAAPEAAPAGPKLPEDLANEVANAEQSAAEGDKTGAAVNLKEARRLLGKSKRLSKDARESVLNRLKTVELAIKEKAAATPPPTTAESTDPNVVTYDGKDYRREGYDENLKVGIWKGGSGFRRKVGNTGTRTALDNIWEARKAIAEEAAKEKPQKKAAPKTETTAAPVPTTRETPSREEIGKGEAQPPPGTKVKHWTWGEGEVVGPGPGKDTTLVRYPDGRTMQHPTKVVNEKMMPKAEAPAAEPAKPDPAAELKKQIDDLRDKILEDKTRATTLKGKERNAINRSIKKDQTALNKLLNKADKMPKPDATPEVRTEAELAERESFRKTLAGRVKKEKGNFTESNVVRPSSTGGQADVIPATSYKGLQIFKEGKNYKPWRVVHEASGNLLGHFENEADAKAFAVRIHEGTNFDFTRPWDSVLKQRKIYGTAKFAEMVADPYAYLTDAGMRLRARSNKIGGYIDIGSPDLNLLSDAREFGQRLYQRGVSFRDWAVNMVKHLGEKIIEHLRGIWDSVTGRNLLPGRGERGGASPGGGRFKAQEGTITRDFASRAEADKFIAANKSQIESHQVIGEGGENNPARVVYKPKIVPLSTPAPAPGSAPAQRKPLNVVTKSGAIIQLKYDPSAANAPPKVNAGTGGTSKPPPPGSALGPTPPGSNPGKVWMNRSISDWRRSWEKFWPRAYATFRLEPNTPIINIHQKWIARPLEAIQKFVSAPFYEKVKGLTREQVVAWENDARTKYNAMRALGQGEQQAFLNSVKGNPLRDYFLHLESTKDARKSAAGILNVKIPGFIEGPYLPRLTTRENQILVEIGGSPEGVVTQLRRSMGSFDRSRKYETMKEGIANGVQYREPIEAVIQHERVTQQLIATAKALKDMEEGGVIFRKYDDALAASKDKHPIKMEGFGGDTWWIRNRQEAGFIDQNLNNSSPKGPWGTATQVINNYARNPNLWNPMPHITKNMFFKYILARVNNATLRADTAEFARATKPDLIDRFHKVFSMPGDQPGTTNLTQSMRMPDIVARETQSWADKITRADLGINGASQKYIFEKADPAMRYSLWKSYIRKGMNDQEAANHVFFDLVRYDENSGGLNFWKSIPFNFFSTWRTGSYVTMYKALTSHPIRTLLFFGAVEYMREAIYRQTGQWTHLPIDYLDAPLSEVVESIFKSKKEIALGRNPLLAARDVALKTGSILASAALFGPGGGQAPDTISDLMKLVQGDPAQLSRVTNMFWGISQLFNVPQEFLAWKRDGDNKHLVNILTAAAFGTHAAIKYEPRRLGKFLFPESLPGMAYSPQQQAYAALRQKREEAAIKAADTHEQRHGVTRGWWQGPEEQQTEDLLRGAGVLREKRQGGAPPPAFPRRPRQGGF